MNGRFNTIYHGDPTAAAELLESGIRNEHEAAAALVNALRRIARLEESARASTRKALVSDPTAEMLEVIRGFVLNEKQINDPHFEGVQRRLIERARVVIAKEEGRS